MQNLQNRKACKFNVRHLAEISQRNERLCLKNFVENKKSLADSA